MVDEYIAGFVTGRAGTAGALDARCRVAGRSGGELVIGPEFWAATRAIQGPCDLERVFYSMTLLPTALSRPARRKHGYRLPRRPFAGSGLRAC